MESLKFILKNFGVYEWLIVRLSAISIMIYFIYIFISVVNSHNLSYVDWYNFFDHNTTKTFSLINLLFVLIHTWIGMRHILEDYIKSIILRQLGIGLIFMILHIYLLLGIMIIWNL